MNALAKGAYVAPKHTHPTVPGLRCSAHMEIVCSACYPASTAESGGSDA